MEFNKPMDVSSFDWDDSELIKAYDRVMKNKKSFKSKEGKASKEKAKEEKAAKAWNLGHYCRATYQEDGLLYEAVIVEIQGDSCTVEYLGYGDYGEVSLDSLEQSLGKKARQKQRKSVKKTENIPLTSDTDYSYMNDSKDVNKSFKPASLLNGNTTAEPCHHYATGHAHHFPQTAMQQHVVPPQVNFNPAMQAPTIAAPVQRMRGAAHCLPPPPMPPCSAAANDPSLSAMLVSWYMAGYYTGLHQNQKSSHCLTIPNTHCCEHHVSNHFGHIF